MVNFSSDNINPFDHYAAFWFTLIDADCSKTYLSIALLTILQTGLGFQKAEFVKMLNDQILCICMHSSNSLSFFMEIGQSCKGYVLPSGPCPPPPLAAPVSATLHATMTR